MLLPDGVRSREHPQQLGSHLAMGSGIIYWRPLCGEEPFWVRLIVDHVISMFQFMSMCFIAKLTCIVHNHYVSCTVGTAQIKTAG